MKTAKSILASLLIVLLAAPAGAQDVATAAAKLAEAQKLAAQQQQLLNEAATALNIPPVVVPPQPTSAFTVAPPSPVAALAPPGIVTRYVSATGGMADLQKQVNLAQLGEIVSMPCGVLFTGNLKLPNKTGTGVVTIRSNATCSGPAAGVRVSPATAVQFAKIQSPSNVPVMATDPGAHHYVIERVEALGNKNGGDIITLGAGWDRLPATMAEMPHDIMFDRVYVHGLPGQPAKRGIALQSASTVVINSYISEIKGVGQDTQAIAGWGGSGPYKIHNNYMEGAGENLIFGGGDPAISGMVPCDITITRNTFSKPLAWRGSQWQIKNLVELKNACRVLIQGNVIENTWLEAQTGWAVVITPRNQDGGCPWCKVEDVLVEWNAIRHAANGLQLLGKDHENGISQRLARLIVRNNLFADIDPKYTTDSSRGIIFTGDGVTGVKDVAIDHNTFAGGMGAFAVIGDGIHEGVSMTNNIFPAGEYGLHSDSGLGWAALLKYAPGSRFAYNVVLLGGVRDDELNYGPGPNTNVLPATLSAAFQLSGGPYATSDSKPVGVDIAELLRQTGLATLP